MKHVVQRLARSVHLAGLLAASGLFTDGIAGQTPPAAGGRDLFVLDLAGTPVGAIPTGIKQLNGILEVVLKDGVPMLKTAARSEFLITLPQVLPQDFTLESARSRTPTSPEGRPDPAREANWTPRPPLRTFERGMRY
jgi:hypothetical protein